MRPSDVHSGLCVGGPSAGRFHSSEGRNLSVMVLEPVEIGPWADVPDSAARGEVKRAEYRWLVIHEGIGCWVHESLIANPERIRDGVLVELLRNYHPPVVR